MSLNIEHDQAGQRFRTQVDGVACVLEYTERAGVMTITHTEVPAEVGGRGIASALVQAAMDTARANGWKVNPACSYSGAWMARHPEYQDLHA